ncbi:MAG: tRNA (guanosine(37)-N1)-methyltransferase TrmD [Candidatus Microsyncoccus archaeolyticus]|nr:MAG: tRNA (guanosine(37)-N1)-methyltransferase TrmD [Candidatus Parcubacteria bacterium]
MQFDIVTIFPHIFDSYFKESLIKKAIDKKLLKINVHNLRDFSNDKRKRVDDRPYGGGLGMVLMIEPIFKALKKIKKKKKSRIILFTPRGKIFNQKKASQLKKYDQIILICGRYEGADERVKKLVDEELSIGEYDLMGGELPAMIVIETISRLIPNVIGKEEILKERITKTGGFTEYPQYTRPEIFNKWKVPQVLLSGDHKKIGEWRNKRKKVIEK